MQQIAGEWYQCLGCGGVIWFLPEGMAPYHPPGSLGHSKPENMINRPGVTCALYHSINSQEKYDAVLQFLRDNGTRLEPPTELKPMVD